MANKLFWFALVLLSVASLGSKQIDCRHLGDEEATTLLKGEDEQLPLTLEEIKEDIASILPEQEAHSPTTLSQAADGEANEADEATTEQSPPQEEPAISTQVEAKPEVEPKPAASLSMDLASELIPLKDAATSNSFVGKFKDMIRGVVAPAHGYYKLIQRYVTWFRAYNSFLQTIDDPDLRDAFLSPGDLLINEYIKVDEMVGEQCRHPVAESAQTTDGGVLGLAASLHQEALNAIDEELIRQLHPHEDGSTISEAEMQLEKEGIAYVHEVLELTIYKLEATLDELFEAQEDGSLSGQTHGHDELDDERVKMALDRLGSGIKQSVKKLVRQEIYGIGRIAAFNMFAAYVASRAAEDPEDPLAYAAPFVYMLGSPTASFTASYIKSLEIRAAMIVLDRMKPMEFIRQCSRKLGFGRSEREVEGPKYGDIELD